jgi:tetratricopeptide (TPR) repeat protein
VKRLMMILLCLSLATIAVTPVCAQGIPGAPVVEKTPALAAPVAEKTPALAAPVVEKTPALAAPVVEQTPALVAPVDSLSLLERAVAKDSTNVDNLYRLGVLYLDRDKVVEAIKVLTKAHQLRPKDFRVSVNLGVAFDASGKPTLAQGYYRETLAAFPEDSVASCRLASSLYSQSQYAEATALLQEIIKKAPRAYCAYFTLGVAFADAGIYRDAIRMWRKVVEIAPTSPEAISARESIDVLEKFVSQ